jgi:predicted PurR-regulated permease PerM
MNKPSHIRFWLLAFGVFLALLYLLRAVMLPFVAGLAAAYFLDPLVDRLERMGMKRTPATALVTLASFSIGGTAIGLLIPLLETQVVEFATRIPAYVDGLSVKLRPLIETLLAYLSPEDLQRLKATAEGYAGTALQITLGMAGNILTGGMALVSIVSLLIITPIVTFYMLRDWDLMTAKVDSWLPRHHAETIRQQLREIDGTLAGFVRGQAIVCLVLAVFYGAGLTFAGLDIGLVVGVLTGVATVIPYLGGLAGMAVGMALALAQFADWHHIAIVAGVFLVGQLLEGNVLTPNLVGDRIRLHPVWIPFSLLAGGALFGFLGVLLAVPVAAVIGVLVRFTLARYLESPLYKGGPPPSP